MLRVFLILILYLCWFNSAYSLPKCKGSPIKNYTFSSEQEALVDNWNNCYGQEIWEDGGGYEGGYKNGKWHGVGYFFEPKSRTCPYKMYNIGEYVMGVFVKGIEFSSTEEDCGGIYDGTFEGEFRLGLYREKSMKTPYSAKSFSVSEYYFSPIRAAFGNLSLDEKKKIQENLKELNYYNSSIDGLYGTNTKKALEIFNKEKLESLDLKKKDNVKTLLSALIEISITEQTVEPKIETAEKQKLTEKKKEVNNQETISNKQVVVSKDKAKEELSMFLCTSPKNSSQKLLQLPENSTIGAVGDTAFRFQKKDSVFFGPSNDGTSFAKFSDNNLLITSAEDDWQGNCVRLQNDIAKTLKDRKAVSSSDATDFNRNTNKATEPNATKIREEFISLSRNKRKHVQAALKSRGLYKSTIDGLYGKNTESAIQRYIDEEVSKNPSYQQKSIRVMLNELRNQFAYVPPKEKKIEKFETSKYTFNAIGSNPKMSARQAYEICEAVASSAALSAGKSRREDYYSTDCSSFSSNNWSCTTRRGSGGGGFAAGFFDAWSRELDRSKAKRIALRGCMAENGWSVRKK